MGFLGLHLPTNWFTLLSAVMKASELESGTCEVGPSAVPLTPPSRLNLVGLRGWGLWDFALHPC